MPKIVNKEQKKIEILQAAIHVFAEKGIQKSKMIDIAKKAGIGKGTIYEYFDSKENIFEEAFHIHFSQMEEQVVRIAGSNNDAVTKLKILVRSSLVGFFNKHGEFAGIMMDFWAEGIRQKDEKMLGIINLKEMYAMFRGVIADILQQGIDEDVFKNMNKFTIASVIIGSLDGLVLQWIIDRNAIDIEGVADELLSIIVTGLKK